MSDERVIALEIKVAFLERLVGDLSAALAAESRAQAAAEDRIAALEHAVRVLAARTHPPGDDVANAEEDPVPSSG